MYKLPANHLDDIKAFGQTTHDFLQAHAEPVKYKAIRVPMGIYEQRTDGTYMVRIRCAGGYILPSQLIGASEIARQYGTGLLHLTTRQELQIQNIDLKHAAEIMELLHHHGLSTKGGGGNTVRNIMASVGSGIDADEVFDVLPYALGLTTFLIARNDSFGLPRKFKIAFSNSEADTAYAKFNDLGFVARIKDGKKGFGVFLGGSLSNKPLIGHELFDFIPASDVALVAETAKILFNRHGNRRNRHKARLRYLFYKLGVNEVFRMFFEVYHQLIHDKTIVNFVEEPIVWPSAIPASINAQPTTAAVEAWKKRYVRAQKQNGLYSVVVPFVNGNAGDNGLSAIADFAGHFGNDTLRFSMRQSLDLRNIPAQFLPNLYFLLKSLNIEVDEFALSTNIVSCTGADTCRLGICLSKGAANALKRQLQLSGLPLDHVNDLKINISGCPNSCGQQLAADLGFYGKMGRNGRIYPGYYVVGGASVGENAQLAKPLGELAARDLPAFTTRLLHYYLAHQTEYTGFNQFVAQNADTAIANLLNEFSHIPTFEQNKEYYVDWGADQPFSLAGRGQGECAAGMFDMIDVDLKHVREHLDEIAAQPDVASDKIYQLVFFASRMLLITRGIEPHSESQVFSGFSAGFIDSGLVEPKFLPLVQLAAQGSGADFVPLAPLAVELANKVMALYDTLDDTLQFQIQPRLGQDAATAKPHHKDLRGVACPMNFVKTKIELAALQTGDVLEILLDDGAPIQNVPGSVMSEGHKVLSQTQIGNHWSVVIQKANV